MKGSQGSAKGPAWGVCGDSQALKQGMKSEIKKPSPIPGDAKRAVHTLMAFGWVLTACGNGEPAREPSWHGLDNHLIYASVLTPPHIVWLKALPHAWVRIIPASLFKSEEKGKASASHVRLTHIHGFFNLPPSWFLEHIVDLGYYVTRF